MKIQILSVVAFLISTQAFSKNNFESCGKEILDDLERSVMNARSIPNPSSADKAALARAEDGLKKMKEIIFPLPNKKGMGIAINSTTSKKFSFTQDEQGKPLAQKIESDGYVLMNDQYFFPMPDGYIRSVGGNYDDPAWNIRFGMKTSGVEKIILTKTDHGYLAVSGELSTINEYTEVPDQKTGVVPSVEVQKNAGGMVRVKHKSLVSHEEPETKSRVIQALSYASKIASASRLETTGSITGLHHEEEKGYLKSCQKIKAFSIKDHLDKIRLGGQGAPSGSTKLRSKSQSL